MLLRLLILAAQLMSIKITITLSLPGTTVHLRLFLVCFCFFLHINSCHFISGIKVNWFQDLDGVIHVTYGVLVVYWWNCARYVNSQNYSVGVCIRWYEGDGMSMKFYFLYPGKKFFFFFAGRSFVSDTWKLRALGHDGKGFRPITSAHVEKSRVCAL